MSYEVARGIGVTQKTAWFMLQRLRLALQEGSIEKYADKFDGTVEIDETFIGGEARPPSTVPSYPNTAWLGEPR